MKTRLCRCRVARRVRRLHPPPLADPERWKAYAEPGSKVANGLDAIATADSSFNLDQFVTGAKSAYEMIVTAFATGDRELLAAPPRQGG